MYLGPRITAILISRFLIDLQEANNSKYHQHSLSSIQLGQIGSLSFNRFVGSLGSSLAAPGEASSEHDPQNHHSDLGSDECAVEGDIESLGQTMELVRKGSMGGEEGKVASRSSTVDPR